MNDSEPLSELISDLVKSHIGELKDQIRKEIIKEKASSNTRGPTLTLSFRLKREMAKRVEDACKYIGWSRSKFYRTAIEGLLTIKEQTIKERLEANEVKGVK